MDSMNNPSNSLMSPFKFIDEPRVTNILDNSKLVDSITLLVDKLQCSTINKTNSN